MRALTYYVGTSVDGYIAGPDDEVDFYPVSPDHIEHMRAAFPEVLPTPARVQTGCDDVANRCFDTVIMGRGTYRQGADQGLTNPYAHLRTYVASRHPDGLDDPAVTATDDPVATVRALKSERDGLDIWLAGGGRLADALAEEIDRLIVKVYPVVAGDGRPLVAGGFRPTDLTLTGTRTFASGCVEITYERPGST